PHPPAPRPRAPRPPDGAWAEAESDHHAVLWWPATRLLALPVTADDGGAAAVGLTGSRETGVTPIPRGRRPGAAQVRRALVVGDALYTVSDAGIMAGDLLTLAPRGY